MTAKKIVTLIFSIAFFCLSASAAYGAAATGQWCHDQAIALQKTCAKTSLPMVCTGSLSSFMSSCDKKFAFKAADLQKMTAAKLKTTLDVEAAKFSIKAPTNGALIAPATAKPFACSKQYITTNCLTEKDCEIDFVNGETFGAAKIPAIFGIWDAKTKKCTLPLGTCFEDTQCLATQYCGNNTIKGDTHKIADIIAKILPASPEPSQEAVDKAYAANVYKCYFKKFGNLACNPLFKEQCLSNNCEVSGIPGSSPGQNVCSCKKIEHCPLDNVCYAPVDSAGYCKKPFCGDNLTDFPFEECDKNTGDEASECTPECKIAKCGDKHPNYSDGKLEECDDGNKLNTDTCNNFCEWAKCGDGDVQPVSLPGHLPEQCDDKDQDDGDGCSATCQIECGNGKVDTPSKPGDPQLEECDDGPNNIINTDTCTNECRLPKCGDGYWQPVGSDKLEQCDDGNNINTGDGCDNECKLEGVEPEKALKDKITVNIKTGFGEVDGEYCCNGSLYCLPPIAEKKNKEAYVGKILQCLAQNICKKGACDTLMQCPNGKKDTALEECDDDNTTENDGCSKDCKIEKEPLLDFTTDPIDNKIYYCKGTPVPCIAKLASDADKTPCLKKYNCVDAICGNSIPDGSEQCDDGNQDNIDNCTKTCKKAACGDEIIQTKATIPETCDDGNKIDDDACTNKCAVAACGDWVVSKDKGKEEECDDGNKVVGDGCSDLCKNEPAPPKCGNGGKPDTKAGEECDDGNKASGDGCSAICKIEKGPDTCGNKTLETPAEECDASVPNSTVPCSKICKKLGTCGDGKKEVGEECDDKNTVGGDGCSEKCLIEVTPKGCGNGKKAKTEECDDGKNKNGDGCSYDCKKEPIPKNCGTDGGVVQPAEGEECDDGNTKNGDGCSMTCKLENKAGGPGAPALTCPSPCVAGQECKANPDPKGTGNICVGICSPVCEAWQTCAPPDLTKPETVKCAFLKDKCNIEADCADATKTCDAVNHNCIVKKSCTNHLECNPTAPLPSQFCDLDKKLCFPLLMAGNSCKAADESLHADYCKSTVCTVATDSKCGCDKPEDCAANQLCETQICKDKLAVGVNCTQPTDCISGNCNGGICLCNKNSECPDGQYCGSEKSLCVAKKGDAEVCEDKDQCLSGDCVIKAGEKTGNCTKPAATVAPAGGSGTGPAPKILLTNPLNTDDPTVIVGRVIEYVIGLTGSLALLMFMYGGAVWIFSGGNDKNIQKGKDTLIWAAIGMAFVFTSYIIVKFVMKLLGANIQ